MFDLKGVDLYEGKIGRAKRGGKKSDGRKRYLRASTRAQEASSAVEEVIEVTYSVTPRRSYNMSLNATNIPSSHTCNPLSPSVLVASTPRSTGVLRSKLYQCRTRQARKT